MRKEGYRESTIRPCIRALRAIGKRTNLLNPEAVKSYLASADFSENRKEKLTHDLSRFYKWKHIPFQKPTYRRIEKLPFIPLESEVDQLISGVGSKTATFLQLLKETGMRAGEAWNLRWTDIDYERRKITRTGGSLEVSIPKEIVTMLKLKVGDTIQFTTSNGDIIIRKGHG